MVIDHWLMLIHPMLAIIFVLPTVGIVSHYAWQVRQRRLKNQAKEKTKISPTVGQSHVNLGRWLAGLVIGVALVGLAHPIFKNIVSIGLWEKNPLKVLLVILIFGVTFGALLTLLKAKKLLWRVTFSVFSGMGLISLGWQDGVFRRENEWFMSHFFYGLTAALLMIVSVAILPEIYRSQQWRKVHTILNVIAFLLFIGLGVTGVRDIFEIALYQSPAT